MSVSFGTPMDMTFCEATCVDLTFPPMNPYDPEGAARAVARQIELLTGETFHDLSDVPAGAVMALAATRGLDDSDLGESRERIDVLGFPRRVVVMSWAQPRSSFDIDLANRILQGLKVNQLGPDYSHAVHESVTDLANRYALTIPEVWYEWSQPMLDRRVARGVRRFGERELTVSVGDPDGDIRLCNAASCEDFQKVGSPARLEAAIADWLPPAAHGVQDRQGRLSSPMSGARYLERTTGHRDQLRVHRLVFGIWANRPYAISFDVSASTLNRNVLDAVVDGFTFFDRPHASRTVTYVAPGGQLGERLAGSQWHYGRGPDLTALYLERGRVSELSKWHPTAIDCCGPIFVSIRMGDRQGRVRACDPPALIGGFERALIEDCRSSVARSLDDLAELVGSSDETPSAFLDGEPAATWEWMGQELPARGGQQLAYVVAMHASRPIVIRAWTASPGAGDMLRHAVQELIDGFRFLD